jgi:hypothetical protein
MRRTQIVWGTTGLALVFLSLVPAIHSAETAEVDRNRNVVGKGFDPDANVSLRVLSRSSENLSLGAVTESSDGEESASELNRKLTNPVSSIWSISNQFNNFS